MGAKEMTAEPIKRLSDARPREDTILIDGFADHDLTIHSFEYRDSQFGAPGSKYVVITADTANGLAVKIRCGAEALIKKLEETKDLMPYVATVKKIGRSYTLE